MVAVAGVAAAEVGEGDVSGGDVDAGGPVGVCVAVGAREGVDAVVVFAMGEA